ncbi:DUF3592 domain-containing protein [Streptomyces hainanensis]|uniref:DUF3592 domain-containing protein n=1 Tax=Streptomyces hainanensis TaxID=402648 RepID=A0A4R4TBX8_9ACTN|nr:DUF3592 domain-containing protein [Streptomyces hainanensis]TDC74770.1 DUF3592 domain-containing protein [Streptomyces hainanensis]
MRWEQLVGAFFVLMLGGLSVAVLAGARDKYRLRSRGRWIEAEVVRVDEEDDADGDPRFYLVVAFTPPGGPRVEVRSTSGRLYPPDAASGVGSGIMVRYDPVRPTRIELSPGEGNGVVTGVLVGLLLAVVAGFVAVASLIV